MQAGEIADQEHDLVASFWKSRSLRMLIGVADVQLGRGRIEALLDDERPAGRTERSSFAFQLFDGDDLGRAPAQDARAVRVREQADLLGG
jgi:hypothetical protein